MARRVNISVFGSREPNTTLGPTQAAVDQMIAYWRGRFQQVASQKPDLVVVPECCDRFTEHREEQLTAYYEVRGDQTLSAFADLARQYRTYVTCPIVHKLDDGSWRNSNILLDRKGEIVGRYDKAHPVVTEIENGILPGPGAVVLETDFGTVGSAICFDLNFTELCDAYAELQPDLLLFPSMYHGGLMQQYWAYRCRTHFVGAVAGLPSEIRSPVGEVIATTTNYYDYVSTTANLDCCVAHLDFNWGRFDEAVNKYGSQLVRHDPGLLGSVLLTSEVENRTIDQIIDEFQIERLDAYMARSRKAKAEAGSAPAAAH